MSGLRSAFVTYSVNLLEDDFLTVKQLQSNDDIMESLVKLISNKTLQQESLKFALVVMVRFIKTDEKGIRLIKLTRTT